MAGPIGVEEAERLFATPPPPPQVEDARAPIIRTEAMNPDALRQSETELWQATYEAEIQHGATDEEAAAKAEEKTSRSMRIGAGAREYDWIGGTEDVEAAHANPDTTGQAMTRAFGRRQVPVSLEHRHQGERDEEFRATEREFRNAGMGDAAAKAWAGEEVAPVTEEEANEAGTNKPWVQRLKEAALTAGLNAATGGAASIAASVADRFGVDLPWGTVGDVLDTPSAIEEGLTDPDVRNVAMAENLPATAAGAIGLTPIPEMITEAARIAASPKGAGRAVLGAVTLGGSELARTMAESEAISVMAQFYDDAQRRPKVDDALATGDRADVDMLGWADLPARLKGGDDIDHQRVIDAVTSGVLADDPAGDEIREAIAAGRTAPAYLAAAVERMPLAALAVVQPNLSPTDQDIAETREARARAAEWAGTEQGQSLMRLAGAALVRPVDEDGKVVFVPGRFAEAMRLMGLAREGMYQADVPLTIGRYLPDLPDWVPEPLRQVRRMADEARLPTKAGLDLSIQSGAFDPVMHGLGLSGSEAYAALNDPESTLGSRVLTSLTLPDYQGMHWKDVFLRAGGDPEGAMAKALGVSDIVIDFLNPAEELMLAPLFHATAMASRVRAVGRAAKEVGQSSEAASRAAMAAAAPRLVGAGVDGIETAAASLAEATRASLETGSLNPATLSRAAKANLVDIFAQAGVPEPEKYVRDLLVDLGARHAAAQAGQPMSRPAAISLIDERAPRSMNDPVIVSGTPEEEVLNRGVLRQGRAANATKIDRASREIRAALGLEQGQPTVDPLDLTSRALTLIATERLRRQWGFGEIEALTSRTAVPKARARRVRAEANAHVRASLGGALPEADMAGGVTSLVLDPAQQAGVARLVREVQRSPLGETLPESLTGPNANYTDMLPEDWHSLMAHVLDTRAGAGALRERIASAAAEAGALGLFSLAVKGLEKTDYRADVARLREMFKVSAPGEGYIGPAQAEVLAEIQRRIGDVGPDLRRDLMRIKRGFRNAGRNDFTAVDLLRRLSDGMDPEVVPVLDLNRLADLHPLLATPDLASISTHADDLHALFTSARIGSAEQTATEIAAVTMLDRIHRTPGTGFDAQVTAAGFTRAQADDAMSIAMEGLRRRSNAVQSAGDDILVAFAGSMDRAVLDGIRDAPGAARRAYKSWYTGDWTDILVQTGRMGNETAGPDFDQGAAALTVLLRLKARAVLGDFAKRMATTGVLGDVADVAKGGLSFDRTYTLGSRAGGRQAYIDDVAWYITDIQGWKDTPTITMPTATSAGKYHGPPGGSHNPAAYADAERILAQWNFKTGKGAKWEQLDLPGGEKVLLPAMLKKPIEDVVNQAAPGGMAWRMDGAEKVGDIVKGSSEVNAPTITGRSVNLTRTLLTNGWGYTLGMLKTGLTTGLIIPNPAFFVGNFIGGAFQLHQGVGAAEALRIMSRPLMPTGDGAVIRRVLARMWKDGSGVNGFDIMAPPQRGFFSDSGMWWDDAIVAQEAQRAGLNSSLAKTELATSLIADIRAMGPTWWNLIARAPAKWQSVLTEASTGIDNYYRVATFTTALKSGRTAEEAAEIARRVAFDYNAMTDFEKTWARKGIMFYAYQRRAQDLFWHTMLTNPSRVFAEMRLLGGLQREALGNDSDVFVPEYLDGRAVLYFTDEMAKGHLANAQRGAALLSPQIPVASQMGLYLDLLGSIHGEEEGMRNLASRIHPWAMSVPVAFGLSKDIHTGRDIDGYNQVPNWLVEFDRQNGGRLWDILDISKSDARDPMTQAYDGAPTYIATNAKAWWVFRNLLQGFGAGRSMDTITAMQRMVDTGEEDHATARPGLTETWEALGWLGIRPQIIDDQATRLSRLMKDREMENEAKTREVENTQVGAYGR